MIRGPRLTRTPCLGPRNLVDLALSPLEHKLRLWQDLRCCGRSLREKNPYIASLVKKLLISYREGGAIEITPGFFITIELNLSRRSCNYGVALRPSMSISRNMSFSFAPQIGMLVWIPLYGPFTLATFDIRMLIASWCINKSLGWQASKP